ncbi:MAG: UDP-N-acetylenolpyruvoylglucosamine reductase [Gammaproteobacteria bacterium]|nr:UDP-N-acetylenolpyruvoylglucosamine reductase [Gammaproteobacteria bacterium]
MMAAGRAGTIDGLRGCTLRDEPMSRHTSWRVGGPADCYFEPADMQDLALFLAALPAGEPLLWIGLGSNLLVRDGGVRGTVINTGGLSALEWVGGGRLRAEAGVPCAKVARTSARAGYTGAEFLCGIPGSMGGALAMNAGAFGGETWAIVERVETIDRSGTLRKRERKEFDIGYREVRMPATEEWFVAALLAVQPDAQGGGETRIRNLLARRSVTQPTGQPSCGSVFRNPPEDHAGRLIEAAGLKGRRVGRAFVSEKHANFIITEDGARAGDVESLINLVQQEVQMRSGIRLSPEVRIIGEAQGGGAARG